MLRRTMLCFVLAASFASGVFAAGEPADWSQLRTGMTPDETAALLGQPLLRSAKKGYELWIYSGGAEVLFHQGPVQAWTAPTAAAVAAASQPARFSHDVFFLPGRPMPAPTEAVPVQTEREGYNREEILRYRRQ